MSRPHRESNGADSARYGCRQRRVTHGLTLSRKGLHVNN